MTSPPETDRQFAYFFLTGDAPVSDLDTFLGVSADKKLNAGDNFKSSTGHQLKRRNSYWRLDRGLQYTDRLERHLTVRVERLEPMRSAISKLESHFEPWVKCVSFIYQSFGLEIPFMVQQELTELGIGLSFEVYPWGDLHEEIIELRNAALKK